MKEEKKGFISINAEPTTVRDTVILSITKPPNHQTSSSKTHCMKFCYAAINEVNEVHCLH